MLYYQEIQKRYLDKGGLPLLNPVEDMNIKEPAFLELVKVYRTLLN